MYTSEGYGYIMNQIEKIFCMLVKDTDIYIYIEPHIKNKSCILVKDMEIYSEPGREYILFTSEGYGLWIFIVNKVKNISC